MLKPTALSTEPALPPDASLLPVPCATPKAAATNREGNGVLGVFLESSDFTAMLSTLLTPDGSVGKNSTVALDQPPLALNSSSAAINALPVVRAEGAELEGEADAIADTDDDTGEGLPGEETDDESAAPENVVMAAWPFLSPPPPAPSPMRAATPETKIPAGNAMPRSPEPAVPPAALRGADSTAAAAKFPAAAVPSSPAGQFTDETAALSAPDVAGVFSADEANKESMLPRSAETFRAPLGGAPAPVAGSPGIPVTSAMMSPRKSDTTVATPVAGARVGRVDTSAPASSAQFAGNALPTGRDVETTGSFVDEKTLEVTLQTHLAKHSANVGTESAESSARMPFEISATPSMTAELPPVAAPATVEATHAPSAVHAVEKVLDAVEATAQAGGNAVQLRLELGDAGPLTVHVSLRNGEVHAVFRSDSVEMREMLAAAWSQQAPGREITAAHAPLAEPEFRPLREVTPVAAATGESSLHSQADAHSDRRQQASAQGVPEPMPASRMRVAARSTLTRNEHADTPRATVSSVHLSTFA